MVYITLNAKYALLALYYLNYRAHLMLKERQEKNRATLLFCTQGADVVENVGC